MEQRFKQIFAKAEKAIEIVMNYTKEIFHLQQQKHSVTVISSREQFFYIPQLATFSAKGDISK